LRTCFEYLQQEIATGIQQRLATITTAGDEMGILRAVVTMQTAGQANILVLRVLFR
jgi:hypothetical protein